MYETTIVAVQETPEVYVVSPFQDTFVAATHFKRVIAKPARKRWCGRRENLCIIARRMLAVKCIWCT